MEDYIKENLGYSPDTGEFFWKKPARGRRKSVGYKDTGKWGYTQICILNKNFLAHRLAWFLYYGEFPEGIIDHINGDKSDNRIINLRIASPSDNQCNRGSQINNSLGIKGVYRSGNKFRATITKDRTTTYLGTFTTIEEASSIRNIMAEDLHNRFKKD